MTNKPIQTLFLGVFISFLIFPSVNAQYIYEYHNHISLGAKAGMSGGMWGLSMRKVWKESHAYEISAGYSLKEGRYADIPWGRKGNYLFSMRYQPYILFRDPIQTAGFYGSVGLQLRSHNNAKFMSFSTPTFWSMDFVLGPGFLIELWESAELFLDIHYKYYRRGGSSWQSSYESGFGVRFKIK